MDTGSINAAALTLAASSTTQKPAEAQAENRELIRAVRAINGAEVFGQDQELTFQIDRETKRPIMRIVDRKSGDVIAQIPAEHVLRMAKQLEKFAEKR